MNLKDTIRQLKAVENKTFLRIIFTDGEELTGLFTEFTSASDNEEGIASIDLKENGTAREYSLFEDEISEIQIASKAQ